MEENTTTAGGTSQTGGAGCLFCSGIPLLKRRWSEATHDHFRSSRMEFWKGIRSLIDDRIARMSREEHKGTHVTVE